MQRNGQWRINAPKPGSDDERYHNHRLDNVDSRLYHENRQLSLKQERLSNKMFRTGASVKIVKRALAKDDDGQGAVTVVQRDLCNWQTKSEPLETSAVASVIKQMAEENMKMPFIEFIGVGNIGGLTLRSFTIAGAFVCDETEITYVWALQQ
ncbi:hypothetical protein EC973_000430 [Apophysomyces ossiformis]|uniref:Uncharacterized protein n=1 Tax=Apophysomyces ossiformis TaxID=679940 RepID=A0A8H7BQG1_9FUNG|nr:hypothetical protein EC973_000430 [Apophysomyces ossiformis]